MTELQTNGALPDEKQQRETPGPNPGWYNVKIIRYLHENNRDIQK